MRRLLVPLLMLSLTGCHAANLAAGTLKTIQVTSQAARSVQIEVRAPGSLAAGAQILSDAGAGLWNGGSILSDAGAGVIAAGGGNVIAAGAGNYHVEDSLAGDVPVVKAGVQLLTLSGAPIGSPIETDSQGNVTLPSVPDGQPISAVAAFSTGGKVYRLAVLLAPGAAPAPVFADPVNTMVESAVSNVLAAHPLAQSPALTFTKLKQVWSICDNAGITVDPADLQANLPPDQLRANLVKIWQQAIASQIPSATDKQTVQDFMNQIRAAAAGQ
ncbi:MAG TPA: hypothetical protein V6D47_01485 [Oscillatoriaceae cyanobacterium]